MKKLKSKVLGINFKDSWYKGSSCLSSAVNVLPFSAWILSSIKYWSRVQPQFLHSIRHRTRRTCGLRKAGFHLPEDQPGTVTVSHSGAWRLCPRSLRLPCSGSNLPVWETQPSEQVAQGKSQLGCVCWHFGPFVVCINVLTLHWDRALTQAAVPETYCGCTENAAVVKSWEILCTPKARMNMKQQEVSYFFQ